MSQSRRLQPRPFSTRKPKPRQTISQRISRTTIGDAGHLLQLAYEGSKNLVALINPEVKLVDTVYNAGISAAGVVVPLSLLAQGADYNNRDGISVRAVAAEVRISVEMNAAAAFDEYRVIVFVDNEFHGAAPAVTDILEAADVRSPFNHLGFERFKILHDQLRTTSSNGPQVFSEVLKFVLGHHLKYTGAAGAAANCLEGQVCYLLISQQAVNTGFGRLYSRFSYVDN
jgi:hypothetical protein